MRSSEKKIDYHNMENILSIFEKLTDLDLAFKHSSVGGKEFQRLEFLGDRIIAATLAAALYKVYPNENEGNLSKRFSYLSSGQVCAEIAKSIKLRDYLMVSRNLRYNDNILGDAIEALIGLVYIHKGSNLASEIILNLWSKKINTEEYSYSDPKTIVQEWSQSLNLGLPKYEILSKVGPDHIPTYKIKLIIKGHKEAIGVGNSKQDAEQIAAEEFLKNLN